MTRKTSLAIAIFTASIFAFSLTSITPSYALTKCELAEAKNIYKHPNWSGTWDDAKAYGKRKCAWKAKQKKKSTASSFGTNTRKRGFVLK